TDELAKAITVLVNNLRPLVFPNSLHDDLLGCLSSDAAKLYVLDKLFVDIAGLQVRILFVGFFKGELGAESGHLIIATHQPSPEGFIISGVAVDNHADVRIFLVTL